MYPSDISEHQRELIEQQRQAAEAAREAAAEQRVARSADVSVKRVEETAVTRRTIAVAKMFRTRTHVDFRGTGNLSAYSAFTLALAGTQVPGSASQNQLQHKPRYAIDVEKMI